jgi:hypothetical protein
MALLLFLTVMTFMLFYIILLGIGLVLYFCVLHSEVGTSYFFGSPIPLVRYLEIVLPLRAGPQLSKIGSPLALVRYSSTAIFSVVRCH